MNGVLETSSHPHPNPSALSVSPVVKIPNPSSLVSGTFVTYPPVMKLQQDQIWKTPDLYIQIVKLERLAVEYKSFTDPDTREGTRQQVTKKEFCRLIKRATLGIDS